MGATCPERNAEAGAHPRHVRYDDASWRHFVFSRAGHSQAVDGLSLSPGGCSFAGHFFSSVRQWSGFVKNILVGCELVRGDWLAPDPYRDLGFQQGRFGLRSGERIMRFTNCKPERPSTVWHRLADPPRAKCYRRGNSYKDGRRCSCCWRKQRRCRALGSQAKHQVALGPKVDHQESFVLYRQAGEAGAEDLTRLDIEAEVRPWGHQILVPSSSAPASQEAANQLKGAGRMSDWLPDWQCWPSSFSRGSVPRRTPAEGRLKGGRLPRAGLKELPQGKHGLISW